jgi:MoaA/NifB/PqqE/SkfB family radical SAM enzyme
MDYLTLFISLKCTNACAHCLYGCSPDHGEHMSWDVFARSVAVAEENQIYKLNFFGGEPLLNPQFFPMLQTTLEKGFSLILATNCRPLSKESIVTKFLDVTKHYKGHIVVVTARDRFHLQFYDPIDVIKLLQSHNYEVVVNDYSNHTVLVSEYNANNRELRKLNTRFSCCNASWTDYLAVLPDGGWTICPVSLEAFSNIFSDSLEEIIKIKRKLPLQYQVGCTECLKDFKDFRQEFETNKAISNSKLIPRINE